MKFFNNRSFISVFLLVFSGTLVILGTIQAFLGTLRWYNASEQSHENLQDYPIYSAEETPKTGVIRVFIAPKPAQTESNVYVFLQNTAPNREALISTLTPEKAQNIENKVQDIEQSTLKSNDNNYQPFITPVQIQLVPDSASMPQGYSGTMNTVLTGAYFRDVLWKFPLKIDINRVSPRGQMSNESVTLSGRIKSTSEMAKVLVHELGHMIDIYYLRQKGKNPDPSKDFYALSWSEPTVIRSGISASSFVSGYASTNQYEDFAETFAMYVFHNNAFAEKAENIPVLQAKYDFLRQRVLGDYFVGTSYEQDVVPKSLWDVTKIVIKTDSLRNVFAQLGLLFKYMV